MSSMTKHKWWRDDKFLDAFRLWFDRLKRRNRWKPLDADSEYEELKKFLDKEHKDL